MSRAAEIVAAIGFEWKRAWIAYLGVGLLLALIFVFERRYSSPPEPGAPEIATISGFGLANRSVVAGKVIVVASDGDGLTGQVTVTADRVRGCEVGDSIEAERIGGYLRLHPKPCA